MNVFDKVIWDKNINTKTKEVKKIVYNQSGRK